MIMKILYYFPNDETVMFQWQAYHIFDELKRHDCFFEVISPEDYPSIDAANEGIIKKIRESHYDIFMTSYHEDCLYIQTIKQIKSHGVATLLFCPDNLKLPFNHKNVCPYFDLTWLTAMETEYLFEKWGAKTIFLPYAANPYFLYPVKVESEINRIGFIGTPYGSRVITINDLLDGGIDLTLHTSQSNVENKFINDKPENYISTLTTYAKYKIGRKLAYSAIINKIQESHRNVNVSSKYLKMEDAVPLSDLSRVTSQYALALSFGAAGSSGILKHPVDVVNLRNFEIPMSGGLQFTRFTRELSNYYEDKKEIVFYHSKEEMIDLAKFYLDEKRYAERQRMKEQARIRSVNDHTWIKRFVPIFDYFGLHNFRRNIDE